MEKALSIPGIPEFSLVSRLTDKYGMLLTVDDVREIFGYDSVDEVRAANRKGTLPVRMKRFTGQRRLYATVADVATAIQSDDLVSAIVKRYGILLDSADLADLFRLKSAEVVRKADFAGTLPVQLKRFERQRKKFVTAFSVAEALQRFQRA